MMMMILLHQSTYVNAGIMYFQPGALQIAWSKISISSNMAISKRLRRAMIIYSYKNVYTENVYADITN